MKNKEDIQFVDKVIETLRKTATEIEEFRVQTALGKAEAKDKYEEVKKKFNLFIHNSEFKIKEVKEKVEELNMKFDELRVQLALGKARPARRFTQGDIDETVTAGGNDKAALVLVAAVPVPGLVILAVLEPGRPGPDRPLARRARLAAIKCHHAVSRGRLRSDTREQL